MRAFKFATLALSAFGILTTGRGPLAQPVVTDSAGGRHFVGTLLLVPDPDGVHMQLQDAFEFDDADGTRWPVPAGTETDGASIPRPFWSIVGNPFQGKYLNAAVVHDYYCDVRLRPWRQVDLMFYDAMIAAGVDAIKAKIMYAAVLYGGPRWDGQAVHNTHLPPPPGLADLYANPTRATMAFSLEEGAMKDLDARTVRGTTKLPPLNAPPRPANVATLQHLADVIQRTNPSVSHIPTLGRRPINRIPNLAER